MFSHMCNDILILIKSSGEIYDNISANVGKNNIFIVDSIHFPEFVCTYVTTCSIIVHASGTI